MLLRYSLSSRPIVDQNVSPSRPKFVAQLAVARLVCRPDDSTPLATQTRNANCTTSLLEVNGASVFCTGLV